MSANLSFRVIKPIKANDISSLKYLLSKKFQLEKGPQKIDNSYLDFFYGMLIVADGEVKKDIEKIISALEKEQEIEIFLEY
jgi:hypothetical protein